MLVKHWYDMHQYFLEGICYCWPGRWVDRPIVSSGCCVLDLLTQQQHTFLCIGWRCLLLVSLVLAPLLHLHDLTTCLLRRSVCSGCAWRLKRTPCSWYACAVRAGETWHACMAIVVATTAHPSPTRIRARAGAVESIYCSCMPFLALITSHVTQILMYLWHLHACSMQYTVHLCSVLIDVNDHIIYKCSESQGVRTSSFIHYRVKYDGLINAWATFELVDVI